jgi:hypothetical protein
MARDRVAGAGRQAQAVLAPGIKWRNAGTGGGTVR